MKIEKTIAKVSLLLACTSLSTPKKIIHIPKEFKGEGVQTIFENHMIKHISVMIVNTNRKNMISDILQACFQLKTKRKWI